jgi:hypothetical protein
MNLPPMSWHNYITGIRRPIMRSRLIAIAAALSALAAVHTAAQAKPEASTNSCFLSSDWKGWTTTAAGDALYLRVSLNDIYRVELARGSRAHRYAGEFLVNHVRGSNWICSALDLDLAIADDHGFRQPLIATGLRRLTPQEVAAIPKKERP